MYILKAKETREAERVLEVLHYNENHEFERVNEVPNMFDRAISISSDWRTGNIYWLSIIDGLYSSIKVTDKSFNKSEYVIHPTKHLIHKIQVYPKRKEIFFSNSSHLFYTSTSPNSTAKLLFSSSAQLDWVEDFAIDYATDKLCWVVDEFGDSLLNCIGIGSSERPLKARNIVEVKKIKGYMKSFAAFDYTFYWTRFKNEHELNLYEQVGNRSHIDSFSIPARNRLYLLPSNCPYNKEDEEEYEEDYEEDYEDSN
ncbi:hypothetical protein HCN44_011168 [Aphidius gifuensis]|uniref:Uncharacterized protein n=1 Tax=Aphidius gifuensis TaxID=684658 RepID=A0A835CRF4_APHGI|nr:hypothetical protein HCN44_011168 [Aphidius gifuensis]